jgi:hypothetical protein
MRQIVRVGLDIAKHGPVHGSSRLKRRFSIECSRTIRSGIFSARCLAGEVPPRSLLFLTLLGSRVEWLGHRVRPISPNYMKQFIKRGKSDAHDARHIEAQATPEDHVMHRFLSAMPHKVSG